MSEVLEFVMSPSDCHDQELFEAPSALSEVLDLKIQEPGIPNDLVPCLDGIGNGQVERFGEDALPHARVFVPPIRPADVDLERSGWSLASSGHTFV